MFFSVLKSIDTEPKQFVPAAFFIQFRLGELELAIASNCDYSSK
jgi:hypothetical protein